MLNTFDRRQEIINIIRRERTVTAPRLANLTGVSVRTVRRDIDAISVHLPIYCSCGRGGGISLLGDEEACS